MSLMRLIVHIVIPEALWMVLDGQAPSSVLGLETTRPQQRDYGVGRFPPQIRWQEGPTCTGFSDMEVNLGLGWRGREPLPI
jgi:hypothetical protein